MSGIEYGTAGLPQARDSLWEGLHLQPPSGTWWSPFGQAGVAITPVVGEYYSFFFYLFADSTLNGLGIQIATAPSSDAVLKLGLHTHDVRTFLPSKLIYASPEITGAPLPGNSPQAVSGFSIPLRRGIYWAGYMFTAGTTLTSCIHQAPVFAAGKATTFPSLGFYGSGATPTVNNGNDGAVARQQSLSDIPGLFAGAWRADSNPPSRPAVMYLLTSSGIAR